MRGRSLCLGVFVCFRFLNKGTKTQRRLSYLLPLIFSFVCISTAQAAELPAALPDQEFWRLVAGSPNRRRLKDSYERSSSQFVIPTLQQTTRRGVYIGVGPSRTSPTLQPFKPGWRLCSISVETTCSNI
jgi:hypothetical protein